MKERVEKVINSLEKKQIKAKYFDTKDAAVDAIMEEAAEASTIGVGGSMTVFDLKLHERLMEKGKKVYWHWLVPPEKRLEVREQAAKAELYLTSTNAITEGGELINIDGVGNRVSAMFYGPKRVIVICGTNKITSDLISAIDRIKSNACPANAKRLGLKTPCSITGNCNDCLSEDRMCNITTIINHKPMTVDLNVYIVGEELGY